MSSRVSVPAQVRAGIRIPKAVALAVVLLLGGAFTFHYVFPYYLHYNNAALFDEFWPRRGWLFAHISSGTVALLIGPFQFSRWLRQRYLRLHRVTGRVYLIAVLCGAIAALGLSITTPDGAPWSVALQGLILAWVTTSGMAYYAIRKRQIQAHQEWTVRSYVVTFAFVTFRFLYDVPPMSRLGPVNERSITYIWASWAVPLLATEVILQLRRMRPHGAWNAG
jgi:uncharacterized membrane protein